MESVFLGKESLDLRKESLMESVFPRKEAEMQSLFRQKVRNLLKISRWNRTSVVQEISLISEEYVLPPVMTSDPGLSRLPEGLVLTFVK